jgi:phosphohistidine phosphatase
MFLSDFGAGRNVKSTALDTHHSAGEIAAMRRLMLLRHAKTERAEPGERDRDRKLTKRGHADAAVIGAYMSRHGLVPDLAVVSPARRTQETWTVIAAAFAKKPKAVNDDRIYNADTGGLMTLIAETRAAHSLLVIGHNPGVHDVALQLIASGDVEARERISESLPTSGLVVIDLAFDDWSRLHRHGGRLEHFVTPRLLAAATD